MQDRLDAAGSKVMALTAHPGFSASQLCHNTANTFSGFSSAQWRFAARLAQPAADGTMPLLECICAKDVQGRNFYGPKNPGLFGMMQGQGLKGPVARVEPEERVTGAEHKDLLWKTSEAACGAFKL